MKKTIFALFETYPDVNQAVRALNADGYGNAEMSVVGQADVIKHEDKHSETAEDAGKGAGIGGIAGLILGAVPFAIPGIGPIISAGTIIGGTISGAGIGAATGGLVGLLKTWFSEDEAAEVENAIKEGHILLAVETTDTGQANAEKILRKHGAYSVHTHKARERAHA